MAATALLVLIVIYLRVSTEEQARKGFSLPEQREACRQKAREIAREIEASGGRVEIREFADTFGGDIAERPVLEEMREFIRRERPTWFVCMDPDRFSRSLKWQLVVADEIEGVGTKLAFVQQEYDPTDPMSKAFFQFRGLMSEIEKAKIIERTSRGRRGKIKAGLRPNGVAPFGYRHIKDTDQMAINEEEATWIRQMFTWVAQDGMSPNQVASRLQAMGVTAPSRLPGRRWYRVTVDKMLRNTTYIGAMRCNRYDTTGNSAIRRLPREKRRALTKRVRPADEWHLVPTPAIIDEDLFHQVQLRLATVNRRGNRSDPRLLSMLLRCGVCGKSMSYCNSHNPNLYIRCNRRYADKQQYASPTRCSNRHHRAENIEGPVWETVSSWLLDPALLERYLAEQNDRPHDDRRHSLTEQIELLQAQLTEKQRSQGLALEKQQAGLLPESTVNMLLASSTEQILRIEAGLADLRHQLQVEETAVAFASRTRDRVRDLARALSEEATLTRKQLDGLNATQRRQLILQLVQSVTINADGTWLIVPVSA